MGKKKQKKHVLGSWEHNRPRTKQQKVRKCTGFINMPYPKRVGHRKGSATAPVVLEVFLDFVCPYSKKAYLLLKEVRKHYGEDKLMFVMHNWVQPWHPQSYYLTQAAIAVEVLAPDKYWDMADLLYENQAKFEDHSVEDLSKNQIYKQLAELAASLGVNKDNFLEVVKTDFTSQQIKFYQRYGLTVHQPVNTDRILAGRQNGIHSSPSFMVNGLIASEASSSWDLEKWRSLLDPLFS